MMNHKKIIVVFGALLVAALIIWLVRNQGLSPAMQPSSPIAPVATPVAVTATSTPIISSAPRQLPGGPYAPADPRWEERAMRLKEDPSYEWKTPIQFYGKVIDQSGAPVEGAVADIIWTDMSKEGSSRRQIESNREGLFSITEIQGKHMTVQVSKEGYYREISKGRSSFEFAGFWESSYYEPDPRNPVIFHLRKKGELAQLITLEGKFVVKFGEQFSIPMPKGAGNTAVTPVKVTIYESDGGARKWKAQVKVEGGGIIPALQEFPFEAPKEGYKSAITLDQDSSQPLGWQDIDEGGRFYIKTAQRYGLLELRQMKGKKTLHYRISINPTGSTNLESAQ